MHPLVTYVIHRLVDPPDKWFPFIAVFYLTNRCSFRCPFCSDGAGKPYHQLAPDHLSAAQTIRLLQRIRKKCDYIVITGGEPLLHPDFDRIMEAVAAMRFREVILTTNGFAVDRHLPAIARSVTSLGFSLNSLDPERSDRLFGTPSNPPGATLRKLLENIELAASFSPRKYEIHISSVATPDNLEDLRDVYGFARARSFVFAACPQLVGVKPHSALIGNDRFKALYDFLIAEKRQGQLVYGTLPYLEHMRDLRKFKCYPFTMLVVSPTGDVSYPCLEIGHKAGNLLQTSNLHTIRRHGQETFGPQPDCDNRCQSACALGFSMMFQFPGAILEEARLTAKRAIRSTGSRAFPWAFGPAPHSDKRSST